MISILIPTYNEQEYLPSCLSSIEACSTESATEVIICDGESTDSTVAGASRRAVIVKSTRSRARQLNAGAQKARGDVLLFLHAHVCLPKGALEEIRRTIYERGYDGGGFSNEFSSHNRAIKLVGRMVHLSVVDCDSNPRDTMFFGDNGIFVTKRVFRMVGGFRELPIMEDYDFSIRLSRGFRAIRIVNPKLVVSPRRLMRNGIVKTQLQWLSIRLLYRAGVSPSLLARYYRRAIHKEKPLIFTVHPVRKKKDSPQRSQRGVADSQVGPTASRG